MNIRNYHHVSPLILLALKVICNSDWSVWSSNFFLLIHRCLLYMYRCIQKPEIITVWTCPPTQYKYCVCMYIHKRHE